MSIGEIGGIIGQCEQCRHTHGTSSCATCGGGTGSIGPPTLPPCRACLDGIAAAPEPLSISGVLQEACNQLAERGDMEPLYDASGLPSDDIANLTISVDAEAATEITDGGPIFAELAPLPETWRGMLTDCADLLKAIADRDPAAAAGYVQRFRELLTRAAQYGS